VLDWRGAKCGIIGIIANEPVVPMLLVDLRRPEYRGYDSALVLEMLGMNIDCSTTWGDE
jgi:glucosamine 6-phosphate synthetase-like amidotransferase/phosphosugar isomerase protein